MCLYEHLIKAQTEIHIINNNLSFIKNKTIQQEFEQLNKLITDILTPDFTDIASEPVNESSCFLNGIKVDIFQSKIPN